MLSLGQEVDAACIIACIIVRDRKSIISSLVLKRRPVKLFKATVCHLIGFACICMYQPTVTKSW